MNTNNSSNNNTVLLFDSSMNFKDISLIIEEKNLKIITFDYESHLLFEEKNIEHEISDIYLTQKDLEDIQEKSYFFAHWFDNSEISHLLHYDEINVGELFFADFHYQLVPRLKKFVEITKLFEFNKNSTFASSFILYEIISSFTTSVIQLKTNNFVTKNYDNFIKIPINIGKFSFSIKLKYNYLKKLTKFFEKLSKISLFQKYHRMKKGNTVLFIDFTTKKYKHIFNILDKFSINLVKFDRIIPAIYNLESYFIIKKSNCLVENYSSLIDCSLKKSIKFGIVFLENNANSLWQQHHFFESFFSLNNKSFWKIIQPILVKQYAEKIPDIVQEIELTKKLYKKYNFDYIIVWSEIMLNHLIAIKLAKKQNISVFIIQHGLYADNPEMINYNHFGKIIPEYSDKFLVWGNVFKKYVMGLDYPENDVEIIGSPLHDGIFLDKSVNVLHKNEFILLATSSPYQNIVHDLTIEVLQNYSESIKKICNVVSKMRKKLVIKLHPQPDEIDITEFVKKIDSRIIVLKAGDITPLIRSCEVLITIDISTAMLEAQILGKPVISFKIRNHLGVQEIIKSNSCLSVTQDNFEGILTQILTDNDFKLKTIDRGFEFSKNYLSKIGFASENLLSFLEKSTVIKNK